ncbi:hypothetical protein [Kitasatospora sp. NPDC088134]|uniref:hypothetical protein n=1 Tax=Kitasatospora sp. NPDC088134 TaxID=3364071 RepID=UPI003811E502
MVAGWVCTVPGYRALDEVRRTAVRCLDGPGVPLHALLLVWAGLVLNAAAIGVAVVLAVRAQRSRSWSVGLGDGLLFVLLPAALVVGVLQYVVLQDVRADYGPQRSPCMGAPLRPGV